MIQNLKLETSVLSTLISDSNLLLEYFGQLNAEMFDNLNNRYVINAILELKDKGINPDFDALEQHFESKGIKTVDVYEYTTPVNSFNIPNYITQLKELQFKRKCEHLAIKLNNDAKSNLSDVFDISTLINEESIKLSDILTVDQLDDNADLIRKAVKEIEFAKTNKGITGCQTGLTEIDTLTGGWQKGHLIILAARPAMGKTSLAITQALNGAIDFNHNILFFSLEMSGVELMKRQISLRTGILLSDLSNEKEIDFTKLHKGVTPIIENGFKLIDNCYSLYSIKAQCRKEHNLKKLDAIYIDYMQLIKHRVDKGRSKEQEVSEISRDLKMLAKELQVPVICLSQLSRAVETRGGDKLPQLSDLRDSGSIEQDADIVNFIYRPEYYGLDTDENGESTEGKAIIFFAKNRHGATKQVTLRFENELTKFSDFVEIQENTFENFKELPKGEDF